MSQSVDDHRRSGGGRLARLALVGALTAGALAVVPAAQADTLTSVRSHVHSADAALRQVVAAAPGGSVGVSLSALESHLRAAGHDAAKLYKHAHTSTARERASSALTKVAAQETRDAQILTPIVGQLPGTSQVDLAGFIASVTQSREQFLSLVTQLLGKLPVADQGNVAGILAQLSNVGSGQVGELAGSISPGSVACPALDAVSQVVASVLGSVQADLSRVQSIFAFLPATAQSQFTGILSGLPVQLNSLVASLKQAFNCSSTSTVPGVGGVAGLAGDPVSVVTSVIGSVSQLVQGLLSSFLPGIGAGVVPSPVAATGPVSGLLGSVTGLIPGLGSLFGGGSTGGLLGGLLGGLGGF